MFRVSRRLDYGIQLMIALGQDESNRSQATAVLSERLHIPLPFLHQIGRALIQGGLIKATPGPHGGLRLSGSLERVSLLQIVETLEGPVRVPPEPAEYSNGSASRVIWEDLQAKLIAYMRAISLKDLIVSPEILRELSFSTPQAEPVINKN
jgi:Rrf2 family protein